MGAGAARRDLSEADLGIFRRLQTPTFARTPSSIAGEHRSKDWRRIAAPLSPRSALLVLGVIYLGNCAASSRGYHHESSPCNRPGSEPAGGSSQRSTVLSPLASPSLASSPPSLLALSQPTPPRPCRQFDLTCDDMAMRLKPCSCVALCQRPHLGPRLRC
jgi:hypothetical protein